MTELRKPMLTKESVLFITGGAKGITAQCAIRLAEAAGCNFILAGRSALENDVPVWAAGAASPEELQKQAIAYFQDKGEKISPKDLKHAVGNVLSSREIHATLDAIQSHGGKPSTFPRM